MSELTTRSGGVDSAVADGHVALSPFTLNLANPGKIEGRADIKSVALSALISASNLDGKVKLDGKVDRYAPWKVAGEVNLLSAALFTDLTMSFKDVDLTVVNPYSGHFVGYKIDKG